MLIPFCGVKNMTTPLYNRNGVASIFTPYILSGILGEKGYKEAAECISAIREYDFS